jgi:hypothetical protein
MLNLEEREERKKTIGASEIYKLLNFDSVDCQELWELKIGLRDYEELNNDSIDAGNILEEDGLNYYAESNNCELILNERIANKDVPQIVCSYDAREKETQIPVENKIIKESTFQKWKRKKKGNCEYLGEYYSIPTSYYCQLQIQIDTSNTEYGVLNVNTLTEEEVENPILVEITDIHNKQLKFYRDNECIDELKKRARYFANCMKYKKRPSELEYIEKEF